MAFRVFASPVGSGARPYEQLEQKRDEERWVGERYRRALAERAATQPPPEPLLEELWGGKALLPSADDAAANLAASTGMGELMQGVRLPAAPSPQAAAPALPQSVSSLLTPGGPRGLDLESLGEQQRVHEALGTLGRTTGRMTDWAVGGLTGKSPGFAGAPPVSSPIQRAGAQLSLAGREQEIARGQAVEARHREKQEAGDARSAGLREYLQKQFGADVPEGVGAEDIAGLIANAQRQEGFEAKREFDRPFLETRQELQQAQTAAALARAQKITQKVQRTAGPEGATALTELHAQEAGQLGLEGSEVELFTRDLDFRKQKRKERGEYESQIGTSVRNFTTNTKPLSEQFQQFRALVKALGAHNESGDIPGYQGMGHMLTLPTQQSAISYYANRPGADAAATVRRWKKAREVQRAFDTYTVAVQRKLTGARLDKGELALYAPVTQRQKWLRSSDNLRQMLDDHYAKFQAMSSGAWSGLQSGAQARLLEQGHPMSPYALSKTRAQARGLTQRRIRDTQAAVGSSEYEGITVDNETADQILRNTSGRYQEVY